MTEYVCEWFCDFMEDGYWYCRHCDGALTPDEVKARLNATERLSVALVMGDEEIRAYEWAIKQKVQCTAADYTRTLAKYIRDVKLAYADTLKEK